MTVRTGRGRGGVASARSWQGGFEVWGANDRPIGSLASVAVLGLDGTPGPLAPESRRPSATEPSRGRPLETGDESRDGIRSFTLGGLRPERNGDRRSRATPERLRSALYSASVRNADVLVRFVAAAAAAHRRALVRRTSDLPAERLGGGRLYIRFDVRPSVLVETLTRRSGSVPNEWSTGGSTEPAP